MAGVSSIMLTLFLVVVLGFVLERAGMLGPEFTSKLSRLVMDITCPAMVVSSVLGGVQVDRELIFPLLGVSFLSYSVITVIALLLARIFGRSRDERSIMAFIMIFGNVGFIGYPVCQAIFGDEAVFYAAILNCPFNIFIFSVGAMLVSGDLRQGPKAILKALVRPACVAAYISIAIVLLGWQNVPTWLARALKIVGDVTVPGSLLVIGAIMARMPLRSLLGSRASYISVVLRLALAPIVLFGLFSIIPVGDFVRNLNTLVYAMPVATFGTMLCIRYDRDPSLITEATFISTVLSLVTIPLLSLLLL